MKWSVVHKLKCIHGYIVPIVIYAYQTCCPSRANLRMHTYNHWFRDLNTKKSESPQRSSSLPLDCIKRLTIFYRT